MGGPLESSWGYFRNLGDATRKRERSTRAILDLSRRGYPKTCNDGAFIMDFRRALLLFEQRPSAPSPLFRPLLFARTRTCIHKQNKRQRRKEKSTAMYMYPIAIQLRHSCHPIRSVLPRSTSADTENQLISSPSQSRKSGLQVLPERYRALVSGPFAFKVSSRNLAQPSGIGEEG